MEAIQSILNAVNLDPWIAAAIIVTAVGYGRVFSFYKNSISERGPGQRRIRQNLEQRRNFLREKYFYVLLSFRRTIDDKFGPTSTGEARINSFDFFMKVSAIYSFGTLIFVYLIAGQSPSVLRIFSDSLSRGERGALAICAITGGSIAVTAFYAQPRTIASVPSAILLGLMPFALVFAYGQMLGFDVHENTFSYWMFGIFFAAFLGQVFSAIDETGFVAVVVLIAVVFSLFMQLVVVGITVDLLGIKLDELPKPGQLPDLKFFFFSIIMMMAMAGTAFLPFAVRWVASAFEVGLTRRYGKKVFYVGVMSVSIVLFVVVCLTSLHNGIWALLLFPTLALPLFSVALDWITFLVADRMLTVGIRNKGGYVALSMLACLSAAVVCSLLFLIIFFGFARLAAHGIKGGEDFRFVDVPLSAELLRESPSDSRLWWMYVLMGFNLIPIFASVCAAIFGFLSWQTPQAIAGRYAGYIRKGFKGDYQRLTETSLFLATRLTLSLVLSAVAVGASVWSLRYLFPNILTVGPWLLEWLGIFEG